jgi:hypothetical protein
MKDLRQLRVQQVIATLLGLCALAVVVNEVRWIIRVRHGRPFEQTHWLMRQWHSALYSYHSEYGEFPSEALDSGVVSKLLRPYLQDPEHTDLHLDGFGRPFRSGGPGRGWSRVISSGRNGILESGAGDDKVLDVEYP